MNTPTKPGQRCRIVMTRSKFNGEGDGPNLGKIVYTKYLHAMRAGDARDSVAVWRAETRDGAQLVTYHGAVSNEADFLTNWLEVLPEEPALPKANQEHRELSHD